MKHVSIARLAALIGIVTAVACAESAFQLTPGEGFVEMRGGKVWYNVVGMGEGTPLLLLHGVAASLSTHRGICGW